MPNTYRHLRRKIERPPKIDTAHLFKDPAIQRMSEHLWRPIALTYDPSHHPPTVNKRGRINGETNPALFPETPAEAGSGMRTNLFRNMSSGGTEEPSTSFRLDGAGNIIGLVTEEILPETENERAIWNTLPEGKNVDDRFRAASGITEILTPETVPGKAGPGQIFESKPSENGMYTTRSIIEAMVHTYASRSKEGVNG